MKKNDPKDGLLGLCIGDALGMPVKNFSKEDLKEEPVTNIAANYRYNLPPGIWSDNSSLSFCLAESLCKGLNFFDIANKYYQWFYKGEWTPVGEIYEVHESIEDVLRQLRAGYSPLGAGTEDPLRVSFASIIGLLPLAYYLDANFSEDKFDLINKLVGIFSKNNLAQISASIYIQFAINLIKGEGLTRAYDNMVKEINNYFCRDVYKEDLKAFSRILDKGMGSVDMDSLGSSETIVALLEIGFWSLLNNHSYRESILTAVNMGGETDNAGALCGALAGIYYGIESIPHNWLESIARYEEITDLSSEFYRSLYERY